MCAGSYSQQVEWMPANTSLCTFDATTESLCNATMVGCVSSSLKPNMITKKANTPVASRLALEEFMATSLQKQSCCLDKYLVTTVE